MAAITIALPKLYDKQQIIYDNRKKKNFLLLSRRWGKTTLSERIILYDSIKNSKYKAAWSAPTWKLMLDTFERHVETLEPIIKSVNRDNKRIWLKNGSCVEYWSSDDPAAGRSRKYHVWVSDETQRQRNLKDFILGSVSPTLIDYNGELWVLGTANGEGSEFHELYLDAVANPVDWYVAEGAISDNPYLSPEVIAAERRAYGNNIDYMLQELDCKWIRGSGTSPLIRTYTWELLADTKPDKVQSRVLAVDAAHNSDYVAIISVWQDPVTEHYYTDADDVYLFKPPGNGEEIDLIALENTLWQLWSTGKYAWLAYDPKELVLMMQRLKMRGVRTFEFTQMSLREMGDSFMKQLLADGKYHHPNNEDLNNHIAATALKFTGNGAVRFVKHNVKSKIDLAVCLSMALWTHNIKRPGLMQGYNPLVAGNRSSTASSATNSPFDNLAKLSPWGN